MPSTWSTRFRLNYQAPGDNLNAWGLILNQQVFQALEDAITKRVAFPLSGTKTLTTENGVEDEARCAFLDITGGAGGTVIIPAVEKWYIVRNAASADVVITTGAGEFATVSTGSGVLVICDAANVRLIRDADMATRAYVQGVAFGSVGDLPDVGGNAGKYVYSDGAAASWRQIVVGDVSGAAPIYAPQFTSGADVAGVLTLTGATKQNVAEIPAEDLDLSSASLFTKSISANTPFTFSNLLVADLDGMAFAVRLTITSAAIPSWPESVKWPGGTKPPLPDGTHLIGFLSFDDGATWDAILGGVGFA